MSPYFPLSHASCVKLKSLGFSPIDGSFEFKNDHLIVTVNRGGDFYVKDRELYRQTGTANILTGNQYIKNVREAARIFETIRINLNEQEAAYVMKVARLQNLLLDLP